MSLISRAEDELKRINFGEEDTAVMIKILKQFFKQRDSGCAVWAVAPVLQKLIAGKCLSPLTGEDDEWNEVGPGVFQNRRVASVFKDPRFHDGKLAYDIDNPEGPRVAITFPYTPGTFTVSSPDTLLFDLNNNQVGLTVFWKRHPGNDLPLPAYQTIGAAGFDLHAYVPEGKVTILPGETYLASTGFDVEVPFGFELQIRSRSSLAIKHQIVILNSPGTIDSDYRGEIKVGLKNLSNVPFEVTHSMRIAQAVVGGATQLCMKEVTYLSETQRGAGGFGSTGV